MESYEETQRKLKLEMFRKGLVQVKEECDPGDMYNMGGRSAAEEYIPAEYVSIKEATKKYGINVQEYKKRLLNHSKS